jgi:hypothetical protein
MGVLGERPARDDALGSRNVPALEALDRYATLGTGNQSVLATRKAPPQKAS